MANDKVDYEFTREVDCVYKDERYSTRDNGAVMRYPHDGKRPRPTDYLWTFGKTNEKTGYNEIAAVRVHRIVATAFHGLPPTKEHVVDHIDTNKQNNRPENLRWVTRLENVLLNPITARRIEIACGSVEAFLENPSKFRDMFQEPNYAWMCTVGVEEAQTSLKRMLTWANSEKFPSSGTLGDWIFDRGVFQNVAVSNITSAITPNAAQRDWSTPSEFPCCPQEYTGDPIIAYSQQLKTGSILCRNHLYSSIVLNTATSADSKSLIVITKSADSEAVKRWALAKITFEDNLFVHTNIGSFFTQEGAEKYYCIEQGLEWFGGDTVDDYC